MEEAMMDWRLLGEDDIESYKQMYIEPVSGGDIWVHAAHLKQCRFCWDKVEDDIAQEWFVPIDKKICICKECFEDFKEVFQWKLLDGFEVDWPRIALAGSRQEQIIQLLQCAGWSKERCVDITVVENYYASNGIVLLDSAKKFFCEFHGILRYWYLKVENLNWGSDFNFDLFPFPQEYKRNIKDYLYDDGEYKVCSEEYMSVSSMSGKAVNLLGEIGYQYPGLVWIDEEGKLYMTHFDYEDEVSVFENIFQLLEYELRGIELDSVAFRRNV